MLLVSSACTNEGFLTPLGEDVSEPPGTLIASPLIHGLAADGAATMGVYPVTENATEGLMVAEPPTPVQTGEPPEKGHTHAAAAATPELGNSSAVERPAVNGDAGGSSPPSPATIVAQSVPAQPSKEFEELPAQLTELQMRALLAEAGFPPETWAKAMAVAWCESHWQPGATGAAGERGIWQIHPLHFDTTHDPLGNARAAYRISGGGYDWSAWSCG